MNFPIKNITSEFMKIEFKGLAIDAYMWSKQLVVRALADWI
jgi:hypothetical protein